MLAFEPGEQQLVCRYCGHVNRLAEPPVGVVENRLDARLARFAHELPPAPIARKCEACGFEFTLPAGRHAGACPACASPAVHDPATVRAIAPDGVLPFVIAEPDARRLVRDWLHGLWFAPSSLAREARTASRLEGLYVPHWTFDARAETRYVGRRGDVHYETRIVQEVVGGRPVRRAVQVPVIRWTPVRGRLVRRFDDLLVAAGAELPSRLVVRLEPWDLQGLEAYDPAYIAGFAAELYTLPVGAAHERAKEAMRARIEQDVRLAIGGDQQIVERLDVTLDEETYKLVLLPVWIARFKFLGKDFRVLVNGRTGAVRGERPWSIAKIATAVLVGLLLLAALAWLAR